MHPPGSQAQSASGPAPTSASTEWIKAHVTDYEVLQRIGKGSYGEVWLGRNVLGSYRALKIIYRDRLPDERPFQREFDGVKRYDPVSRTHPGLVGILHVGGHPEAGYFYYAMELADDVVTGQKVDPAAYVPRTLSSELRQRVTLPWEECLSLGLELSAALAHLHNSGLIHCDVKPANIIFCQGRPKLADIGLVTEIGEAASARGTQGYIPPELLTQPGWDVFSLGRVLVQALTGDASRPFDDTTMLPEMRGDPRQKRFCALVRQACALNAKKRFQSADRFHAELSKLAGLTSGLQSAAPLELRVVIIHHPTQPMDAHVAERLRTALEQRHCRVSLTRHVNIGLEAGREAERQIAEADVAIVLLSSGSVENEVLALQVETAQESARLSQGKPRLLAVRLQMPQALPDQLAGALDPVPQFAWDGAQDDELLTARLVAAVRSPAPPVLRLRPPYGAEPLNSAFYVKRRADDQFSEALSDREGLILVKGARQIGKTSMLARGLQEAREQGLRVVWTDFQKLNAEAFSSLEKLYLALGESIAACLHLDIFPADVWEPRRGANHNFERYLRQQVLETTVTHLVWGMDEVDRLLPCPFSSEFFALLRAWYNERSVDPASCWTQVTVAMSYATEAHLFISNLDMSPFNVGTRLELGDFSHEQVEDLNRAYGSPLKSSADLKRFALLLGGQPFLVRRGLHELATQTIPLDEFERRCGQEHGIFEDHLRRLLIALARDSALVQAIRKILHGEGCSAPDIFYRLRSAGLIVGESTASIELRCPLYADYLRRHLE